METRIAQALTRLFEKHRIVFWYDTKRELRSDFEALALTEVEKVELANNEYGLKHRILREAPTQKFLLFHDGPQPPELENWLLDVQLAHGEFRTDQAAIWLAELDLGLEFADLTLTHTEFFQAVKRKDALKRLLKPQDTKSKIHLKMLAVCAGSEARLDSVMEYLLQELSEKRDEKIKLIDRCGLDKVFWKQVETQYGYTTKTPAIRDFVIELFKSCYAMGTDGEIRLSADALVFLKRWKDSRQFEASFEALSNECGDVLGIEQDLGRRDFRDLIELDYFQLIDKKIISDLVRAVVTRTVSTGDVALWVRQRRQSHWYDFYRHLYEAIDFAAKFMQTLKEANLTMSSLADGVQRYCRSWYQLDQLYRKFTFHVRESAQRSLLSELEDQIEDLYSNNYLMALGNRFQEVVEATSQWDAPPIPLQRCFFDRWVKPFLDRENKVCVIISDAMRYEVGDELLSRIRQEDRYGGELEFALSMLPSYTQLGMAALLPNRELAVEINDTGWVTVDGQSSQGTPNREKILRRGTAGRGTAIQAEELMSMKGDDCRAFLREHDVIYVYHNHIDATGDKRSAEDRVFQATEDTLQEVIQIIKKLTAANANNLLVTADHGFLYQNRPLDESDFSSVDAEGEQILFKDRRFVFGKGLVAKPSLHKFQASQLGLAGDVEVQIPKSINRLRLKGAGSRYVHGGASLQEIVIPVLKINKKRQSDLTNVDVDILAGSSSVISSSQVGVILYQTAPVTEKVQPRELVAGIYTESGELISDRHELKFDLSSENPRERELQVRFVLTRKADEVNNREVILRLSERIPGTTHFQEYRSVRYMMRRSFTSDFDF